MGSHQDSILLAWDKKGRHPICEKLPHLSALQYEKMHILVNISQPVALFHKVYLDVMKMPEAKGKNWIVACRDDMSSVSEG